MPTQGNFSQVYANGVDITDDVTGTNYTHTINANSTQSENTGIARNAPGAFNPDYSIPGGYARHGMGALTAHNLFSPAGIGNANDIEFIISEPRGVNASPVAGDLGVLYDGTLMNYVRHDPYAGVMTFDTTFRPRGKRIPPFPVLLYSGTGLKTATNFSSTPYDDGAEGNGTLLGAVAVLQIITPTGVVAAQTFSLSGTPSDGDHFDFVIGGITYTYTFKTALTPTAGQVLISGSAAAAIANLFAAMTGGVGSGTTYAAGTTPIDKTLVTVSVPTVANVITLTAVITGTAANAYSLAKTGVNLVVTGANMAGGVAGDTYNITLATATTSGGSYTTHVTWSGVGALRQALRAEIPIGTTINEWWKLTVTLASGTGLSQTFAAMCMAGRFFQL